MNPARARELCQASWDKLQSLDSTLPALTSSRKVQCMMIQELWAGNGAVYKVSVDGRDSFVAKCVQMPKRSAIPKDAIEGTLIQ